MSVTHIRHGESEDMFITGLRLGCEERTIAGAATIPANAMPVQYIDGGASSRNVTFSLDNMPGKTFFIVNEGTDDLVILDDDATPNTVTTLGAGDTMAMVLCNGEWKLLFITASGGT